jgi:hypothetical protein
MTREIIVAVPVASPNRLREVGVGATTSFVWLASEVNGRRRPSEYKLELVEYAVDQD